MSRPPVSENLDRLAARLRGEDPMATKKNPADATLRNVRAATKRTADLRQHVNDVKASLEARLQRQGERLSALELRLHALERKGHVAERT